MQSTFFNSPVIDQLAISATFTLFDANHNYLKAQQKSYGEDFGLSIGEQIDSACKNLIDDYGKFETNVANGQYTTISIKISGVLNGKPIRKAIDSIDEFKKSLSNHQPQQAHNPDTCCKIV